MAEGKWTVRWAEGWGAEGGWLVVDPDEDVWDGYASWHRAVALALNMAEEDRIEAVVAEAGRGWPSGE